MVEKLLLLGGNVSFGGVAFYVYSFNILLSFLVLSYKTAIKCIAYLSSEPLVRQNRLLTSSSGKTVQIERLLTAIDNSEV